MVDSNIEQREKLLFSEKAWAYRIKMEALNHNGVKSELNSVEILTEQTGESRNQIFRLIRLTELINALLDRVDTKQLAFNPAVELSYLSQIEQTAVASAMEKYEVKPSLSQAVRLKK
jgi:ParB family chromosome partitioning protein